MVGLLLYWLINQFSTLIQVLANALKFLYLSQMAR